MDPSLTYLASILGLALVIGALSHTFVKNYGLACVLSVLIVGLIGTAINFSLFGYVLFWNFVVGNIMVATIFGMGIGIPFHRRRTGRGLWGH